MSNESIRRIDGLRSFYKSSESNTNNAIERELREVKSELKILNDENAMKDDKINNAMNSPYLPDKEFFYKDVIFNSESESKWKEVRSYESLYNGTINLNLKKLNII